MQRDGGGLREQVANWGWIRKIRWFRGQFRPYFETQIAEPIGRFVEVPDVSVGFILMACAIDWLAGYWWGSPRNQRGAVRNSYVGFVEAYFPKDSNNVPIYDASNLYSSLRNGVVHLFSIENQAYAITIGQPALHLQSSIEGHVILNSENLYRDFLYAKDAYFDAVNSDPGLLDKLALRYLREGTLVTTSLMLQP